MANWDVETRQHNDFYKGFCNFMVICVIATMVTLGLMAIFLL